MLLKYHVVPIEIGFFPHYLVAHKYRLATTLARYQQQTELLYYDYQSSTSSSRGDSSKL